MERLTPQARYESTANFKRFRRRKVEKQADSGIEKFVTRSGSVSSTIPGCPISPRFSLSLSRNAAVFSLNLESSEAPSQP